MIDIRLPNITASTEHGQLEQIRSYLYQFAEQINYALGSIDSKADEVKTKAQATTQQKNAVEQANATFSEVKSLIIKSADIINAYYEEINRRLEGVYVAESEFSAYKEETAATLTANSTSIQALQGDTKDIQTDIGLLDGRVKAVESFNATIQTNIGELEGRIEAVESGVESINSIIQTDGERTTITGSSLIVGESSVVTDATLIDKVYPVGSVYMSVNDVNPSAFLGGTWEQMDDLAVYAWKRTN